MARTTLSDLRSQLRVMGAAGFNDATGPGTVTFWSDDHLDAVLDRHRTSLVREPLSPMPTYANSAAVWYDYAAGYANFEQTQGGTALFVVDDSAGVTAGTALWSADYARGVVTFAANTNGLPYFLTARSYDLNAAAADVWRTKAAQLASAYDISTDNHSLSRSQLMRQAHQMADYYASMGEPIITTLYRSDNF